MHCSRFQTAAPCKGCKHLTLCGTACDLHGQITGGGDMYSTKIQRAERRSRIYVMGPLTSGPLPEHVNIARAITAGSTLLAAGFNVYIPHLNAQVEMVSPTFDEKQWVQLMLDEWIPWCDAVFDLGGDSPNIWEERFLAAELRKPQLRSIVKALKFPPTQAI